MSDHRPRTAATSAPRPSTDAALKDIVVADGIVWQEPLNVFIESPLIRAETWRAWITRSKAWARSLPSLLLPWLLPLLLVTGWEAASRLGLLSSRVLPAPMDTLAAARDLALSGDLWTHIRVSAGRALAGLAIGGGLGLALGLLTGSFGIARTLLDSTVQMIRNIPALALIPLVILWFGIDEGSKLFLIAVTVFFPMYLNTFHGIRNVDPALIEMARAYGLSGARLYRDVILPGALPSILVGLRYALGLMWVVLIVAETISAQAGIGYMTMNAREFLQTDVVLVGILLYALLGKIADALARLLERVFLRWHPAYQPQDAS